MNCSDYQELLSAYLDRALPTHEHTSVARHLENCVACHADLSAYLKVKESLRGQTMPSIPSELIAEIEAQTVLRPSRWTWVENVWRWGPLTAGALAMAVWAFAVFQNAKLQMHEPRVPLQAVLAQRTGKQWALNDERRIAVYHVTEDETDPVVPPQDSETRSDASPQP